MNKMLMTGLAVGTDVGVCSACNYDFEWLIKYPSIFLWADKILLTQTIYDQIVNANLSGAETEAMPRSIKLVFEMAKSEDIIELVDPTKVVTDDMREAIWQEVINDLDLLKKFYPNNCRIEQNEERNVPMEFYINDIGYCGPFVATIYATLALTRAWDSNCFFSQRVLNYLVYKFGLSNMPYHGEPGKAEAFTTVFNAYLPNVQFLPEYPLYSYYDIEQCDECKNKQTCQDTYLLELEKNFKKILTWRNYDEILQLKQVVEKITDKRKKSGGIIDPEIVLEEFRHIEGRYQRRIKKIFPKVKRWANFATMLSIPVAMVGLAVDQPLVTVTGGVLTGASKLTEEITDYLKSKMSWVRFTAQEEDLNVLKTIK
jgi:hypothetical protein